ncbi:MAG: ribosomal protein small subunit ribosomal protein [Candidatus Parcubacteria bacterium]|jgi:small subunit ribosomal protein S4
MITGPKYKICKRLGSAIFEKCQTAKFAARAENAPVKRKGRGGAMSEFKRQLTEKQKMRLSYGITEKQLSRYVDESLEMAGDPAKTLVDRLESRLDNVIYRMGIAKTRRLARQMVSHGHITVNGRKMTIPSYKVEQGDIISVRAGSRISPLFATLGEQLASSTTPAWITFDAAKLEGSKRAEPQSVIASDHLFDPVQVLQFYSR